MYIANNFERHTDFSKTTQKDIIYIMQYYGIKIRSEQCTSGLHLQLEKATDSSLCYYESKGTIKLIPDWDKGQFINKVNLFTVIQAVLKS